GEFRYDRRHCYYGGVSEESTPNVLSKSNEDEYFLDTPPERWNFLNFYHHWLASFDFSNAFKREAFKLRKALDILNPVILQNLRSRYTFHPLKANISNMGSRLVKSNINSHDKETSKTLLSVALCCWCLEVAAIKSPSAIVKNVAAT
ncbi:379_t:CDS:2, partial [Paraglomus brasilianum]